MTSPEDSARNAADASPAPPSVSAIWSERRPLRLVIAGGGTGGHVQPAVAVLEELARRGVAVNALWIGSRDGTEGEAARRAGVAFRPIATGKLRRYLDVRTVRDAARIPIGIAQAWQIIRRFHPDVVLSTGGFVSVPTVAAASGQAPVVTHEQTAILGLATRINLRFRPTLAVSFPETAQHAAGIGRHVVHTGNPIRPSILGGDPRRGRERFGLGDDLPILTVMGGARGASPINQRLRAMLPDLLGRAQIVHQTGPQSANRDAADLAALRATWPEDRQRRYVIREFIADEIADLYAMTDLVLARAGAGTVAELAALGLPSILIPLPHAGGDEQTRNAESLARAGGGEVIREADATPERLRAVIDGLLDDPDRRRRMASAARSAGHPAAAARLVDLLLDRAAAGRA